MLETIAVIVAIAILVIAVIGNSIIVTLLIKQYLKERRAKQRDLETQALLRGIPSVRGKKK